jgi:hypothetical protein
MFGNPEWFRVKSVGWGLRPVSWRGWLYSIGWAAAIGLPFLALLGNRLGIEAIIWLAVAMSAFLWDVRQIVRQINGPKPLDDDVLVIDDDEPNSAGYATQSYDLQWRR